MRYGHAHGVRACYAELYPNWGEGPKPYVFLKLWWDPQADIDALLDEWYQRCVGPDAAPYLAKYYAIWERFWTKDILDSAWFSTSGQYLRFDHPGYLADVREKDVLESRRLLDTCIDKCQTDKQRARAKLLEKAFQYYEASALAYLADRKLPPTIETEAQALAALNSAETAMHMARNMWAVMGWVAKGNNAVRQRVAELTDSSESEHVRDQAGLMLAIVDGNITPISKNHSFEEGKGNLSDNWSYWVKPDPVTNKMGRMLRTTDRTHDGERSLLCDSMFRGGPVNSIRPLPPGKYYAFAWVYVDVPEGTESKGYCELAVVPRGADGRNLPGLSTKITPPPGKWTRIVAGGKIEAEIYGKEVTHALMIPIVDGFQDGGKVYWDEVALYRVEEAE